MSTNETIKDVLIRVAAGNPGALSILIEAIQFDQDLGVSVLQRLDRIGLRGPQVWNLSKLAERNPAKTLILLLDEEGEIITALKSGDIDRATMERLASKVGTELR